MSEISVNVHNPVVQYVNVHDSGCRVVRLGSRGGSATLCFVDEDALQEFINNLQAEAQ